MQKKPKMKPDQWVQIGGDIDYTSHLILGKYDPDMNEIHVIQLIEADELGGKKFISGSEAEFDIDELQEEYDINDFGLTQEDLERRGIEMLAEEVLTTYGGDPINCDGQADYKSEFRSFKKALQCAIGDDEFISFEGKLVKADDF